MVKREVGALVGSGPDGVLVRVKRGSKVDFIDSVSVTWGRFSGFRHGGFGRARP